MSTPADYNGALLREYELLPELLRTARTHDDESEILAAMLCRDELSDDCSLQNQLPVLDYRFAEALAGVGKRFMPRIREWSANCAFGASPWWLGVLTQSRSFAGQATSAIDLLAPFADFWFNAESEAVGNPDRSLVTISTLQQGYHKGIIAVGNDLSRRSGQPWEGWHPGPSPSIVFPGSANVGFLLPHQGEDGKSGPLDPRSVEAGRCLVGVVGALQQDIGADISPWIVSDESEKALREAFTRIRGSVAKDVRLRLMASLAITDTTVTIRNPRKRQRRPIVRPRHMTLSGVVRAIDLDDLQIKLKTTTGAKTIIHYVDGHLFLQKMRPGDWLDAPVSASVYTYESNDPPKSAQLVDMNEALGNSA